jgi:DNA-binding transcriptional ArsR family regulator
MLNHWGMSAEVLAEVLKVTVVMKSLADPTRRAVFEAIARQGEVMAGALAQGAAVSQPAVSQHLRALKEAGLVAERKAGRHVYYRAEPAGLSPLMRWMSFYSGFWRDRFANLETLLKELER